MSGPAELDTKANRKKLRELAAVAHERELSAELGKVEQEFARWRRGEIDPFELNDRIHRFHDGTSRDLYATRGLRPHQAVARAVAYRILDRTEIPSDILAAMETVIGFFEQPLLEAD
ncbi:MAG: hypothetical protein ABJC13_19055 [Acidobacteriota bacterium]